MEGRTMRRALSIALGMVLLTAGLFPAPAVAAEAPKCANITGDGGASYYQVDAPGYAAQRAILFVQITTELPLCKNTQLRVFVSTDGTSFTGYSFPGDSHFAPCAPSEPGTGCLSFTLDYGDTSTTASTAPAAHYVYLQTSTGKSSVSDRAPDDGSAVFTLFDHDATTADYDSTGKLIDPCGCGGGNYFQ
jgi:hypothetical protein